MPKSSDSPQHLVVKHTPELIIPNKTNSRCSAYLIAQQRLKFISAENMLAPRLLPKNEEKTIFNPYFGILIQQLLRSY
jgi:hypothetical protein